MRGAMPIFTVGIALLIASIARGATPAVEDLRAAAEAVIALHPRPFHYLARADFESVIASEVVRLESLHEPGDLELGRSLHHIFSKLGDSHIAVGLPSFQPEAAITGRLFPVLPKHAGARVFVDASDPVMPHGTELLAINGEPVELLLDALRPLALVDGLRPSVRAARIERNFTQHLHLWIAPAAAYRVRVRHPEEAPRTLSLAGCSLNVLRGLGAKRISAPARGGVSPVGPALPTLHRISDSVVRLRLASFGVADQEAYQNRVEALFSDLDGSETLILDLRGNRGGLRTHGIAVLNHLIEGAYSQWSRMEVRAREIPKSFRERVSFPFTSPSALSEFPGASRDGRIVFEGDPLAERMRGGDGVHQGPVVVFTDDGTDSAAVEMLAALLAHRDDARVIGSETGGECGRHIGEIPVVFKTPNLGVHVLFSLVELTHVKVRGCRPGRGFEPDTVVDFDERDFLEGRDPYLAALKRLNPER